MTNEETDEGSAHSHDGAPLPFDNFACDNCGACCEPTRPFACVMVEPGDAKCQQARKKMGLPMLRDRDGNEPSREVLEASCEEYELSLDCVM